MICGDKAVTTREGDDLVYLKWTIHCESYVDARCSVNVSKC